MAKKHITGQAASDKKDSFQEELAKVLNEDPGAPESEEHKQVVALLKEVARSIHKSVFSSASAVLVRINPSITLDIGQQFKMVVTVPSAAFVEVLFVAYVPANGYPVTLDLYGEGEHSCATEKELRESILKFLGDKNIRRRLYSIRELLP